MEETKYFLILFHHHNKFERAVGIEHLEIILSTHDELCRQGLVDVYEFVEDGVLKHRKVGLKEKPVYTVHLEE